MDRILDVSHAFESHAPRVFIFQLENILGSNFNFSTSYGHLTDLMSFLGLLLVRFPWFGEKNSLKYLLIGVGTFVPPCLDGVDIAYAQTG